MEDNDICIDSEKDDPLQIFVDVGLNDRFIRDCKGISKAPLTLSGMEGVHTYNFLQYLEHFLSIFGSKL